MITKISINNFKKIETLSFDLSSPLVLIGPNNSGKTSILQAIMLWEVGLKKWAEKKNIKKNNSNGKRQGVSINRRDLISLPVPSSKLLWYNLNTHFTTVKNNKNCTDLIFLDINIEGYDNGKNWSAALEFYYANEESFYCRPMRNENSERKKFEISEEALKIKVAYLQPMSGMSTVEDRLTYGSIDRKIGEGKTADVIRNICYQLLYPEKATHQVDEKKITERWVEINSILLKKFGITIHKPVYNPENGLIDMNYSENGKTYDLSSAGRGFQQTLLLLCFLYSNPCKIILMDEPDAHLEVLRQKEIYNLITEITRKSESQLIIATHSEVVLREAALKEDKIVAILQNTAINLNDSYTIKNFRKSLTDFGWDKYYLARQKRHCIYLEGTTDIENLEALAKKVNHPIADRLETLNIDPIENNIPGEAFARFQAMKLVYPTLKGICLFDRIGRNKTPDDPMPVLEWKKRELENYFISPELLIKWATLKASNLLTTGYPEIMNQCIIDTTPPLYLKNRNDPWWDDFKLGDWAESVFKEFSKRTHQPIVMKKSNFYELISILSPKEINPEIIEKLDAIYQVIQPELSGENSV